ncbi:MAG: hypothetical protein ACI83I_002280, partial [Bacteroidia bacterium]
KLLERARPVFAIFTRNSLFTSVLNSKYESNSGYKPLKSIITENTE